MSAADEPQVGGTSPFDIPTQPPSERIWDIVLAIAAGGALGGAARHGLNTLIVVEGGSFPWSTLVENVVGSFLLGMLMVFLLEVWPPNRYLRPFLGVGLLGGFTTFSAYTSETRGLLQDGEGVLALTYLFGSVALGLLAVWIGITTGRAITRDRPWRQP